VTVPASPSTGPWPAPTLTTRSCWHRAGRDHTRDGRRAGVGRPALGDRLPHRRPRIAAARTLRHRPPRAVAACARAHINGGAGLLTSDLTVYCGNFDELDRPGPEGVEARVGQQHRHGWL
jgi:hypothetical protein